ncbi:MAG: HAD hydrolase-like protein [Alphaproteobacteria bacterium]
MKKNLFLDCDGVLYPQSKVLLKAVFGALKEISIKDILTITSKTSSFFKKDGFWNFFQYVLNGLGEEKIRRIFDATSNRIDYNLIKPEEEIFRAIRKAQTNGWTVSIVTNGCKKHVDETLKSLWGINLEQAKEINISCFDIIDLRDNGRFYPKSKGGLQLLCKRTGAQPQNCLLIDDSKNACREAEKMGIPACNVTSSEVAKKIVEHCC